MYVCMSENYLTVSALLQSKNSGHYIGRDTCLEFVSLFFLDQISEICESRLINENSLSLEFFGFALFYG